MRQLSMVVGILVFAVLTALSTAPVVAADATITLLNPPQGGLLELAVGESHTFDILIESSEPFVVATALTNAYYPGRGVFCHCRDRATHASTALLHLTMTGKASTADLPVTCDWPEPDTCWGEGIAPVSIVAGIRSKEGIMFAEEFPFAVRVPGG